MKNIATILAVLAVMIFFTGNVEAAYLETDSGKNFVAHRYVTPPRMRQLFPPPERTPRKDYAPRRPFRPTPRYRPNVPKPTNDNRGGKRKNFGPPRAPQR